MSLGFMGGETGRHANEAVYICSFTMAEPPKTKPSTLYELKKNVFFTSKMFYVCKKYVNA